MNNLKNIIPVFLFFFAFFLQGPEDIQSMHFNKKISHKKALSFSRNVYAQEKRKNETADTVVCLLPADISEQVNHHKFSSFKEWLSSFKKEAKRKGVSRNAVDAAFNNVQLIDKVVEFDRKQKEYSLSFTNYISNSISISRIKRGKRKMKENAKILQRIQTKYGIPPEILVALWGLESDFGGFTGNFSTVNTLATLAYDGRRRNFFTNELFCALAMLDSGNITVQEMTGSWAGAMGQPQFMPSTFYYYAVDGNGDGKKDLWENTNDVLSSAANYLSQSQWKTGEKWGVEVILPKNFDPYQAQLS
ncbi:MAG: lytic murein transglycosylase, partial [Candidatus Electrothrix sp. ATG2]|nr:lytic murein transglycosylase [Candidatus Electrothrix sp. ATG2]